MPHRYQILDVFTDTPLTGNPLAVVFDADGLEHDRMQAIAAEFNLSESIFVAAPKDPANTASARIFTPKAELPFAGHPTVGATVALAGSGGTVRLELPAGLVVATVEPARGAAHRSGFAAPRVPAIVGAAPAPAALAAMLGLTEAVIGWGGLAPCRATAGPNFTMVPVADALALERARGDAAAMAATLGTDFTSVYLFTGHPDGSFQARMFAPLTGIPEDPATGSAAVALAAVLAAAGRADGREIVIRQGAEMGRPSTLRITPDVADAGRLAGVRLAGEAVTVADGTLRL
jgi:trans-2,3-dihydro-3-hydroxyanthranilate isomerase